VGTGEGGTEVGLEFEVAVPAAVVEVGPTSPQTHRRTSIVVSLG
jgi:hypothetical protein